MVNRVFRQFVAVIITLSLLAVLSVVTIILGQKTLVTPSAEPTPEPVNLSFPQGGENLQAGKTYTIKWSGGENPLSLFLIDTALENQGESVSIVDRVYNIPNTGTYDYYLSPNVGAGTYKLMIGTITSHSFTITGPQSSSPSSLCAPNQLSGVVTFEAGAGNVYGTLTLTNTSDNSCQFTANNQLDFEFINSSPTNITFISRTPASHESIVLSPGQTIYSQIHYPNGPQCTSLHAVSFMLTYQLSSTSLIKFKPNNLSQSPSLQICDNSTEITTIDTWAWSTNPISQ